MDTDRNIYRGWVRCADLMKFTVSVAETDLMISASSDLSEEAERAVREARRQIEGYIAEHPDFAATLKPCEVYEPPAVVREMAAAGRTAGVGPMAAVAGAVAEFVGRRLRKRSPEVVVENGGDIYMDAKRDISIGLFAGASPFTGKLALAVGAKDMPLGVCTSSGTVGHSLSFGKADAVTVICRSAAVADAYATALCNVIKEPDDIDAALKTAKAAPKILGVLAVMGDRLGTWGKVRLIA